MAEVKAIGEEQIRQRAYEIYLSRNGNDGDEVSDWLKAERELTESGQPRSGPTAKKAKAAAASI